MGLYEAVVEGVAERAHRREISRWERAREMLELQAFLRDHGRAHTVAQLERLTGVRRNTIAEQLVIAEALTPEVLASAGVAPMALAQTPHSTLLRIAQLPGPMRAGALRDSVGSPEVEPLSPRQNIDARYRRRAHLFERLRDEGGFHLSLVEPLRQLSTREARLHVDQLLPLIANLAEKVSLRGSGYYIGTTGNGGLLIYLGATQPAQES